MQKTVKIKPITDIIYGGTNHKAGSEPFEVDEVIAARLVEGGKAEYLKAKKGKK